MDYLNLVWIVVAAALIVWIAIRQFTWQALTVRNIWMMPLVLMGVGVLSSAQQWKAVHVDAAGIGLLALELGVGVGIGALMGVVTRFRRLPVGAVDSRGRRADWETRTGWVGLALWVALIVLRLGGALWAHSTGVGGGLLTSSAAVIFVVGANRLARSAVLQLRLGRSVAASAA